MNKISLILVILIITTMSQAQNYKVVHVNGDIVAESTHKNIVRGTAFGEKEKFQYKTNDARAVVINAKLGTRFILKGKVSENTFSKANLTPSMGNISSRGGALNNRLDLKNHFDGKYVILGQLEVVINKAVFPMNDTQFFYISYIYNSETINKKLEFHGDTLIINKDSLLKIDGKPIKNEDITQMKLMYYTKNNGKVNLITISDSFYPIFPDENELKSEVDIIINALPKDANKLKPVIDYINEVYGKVNNDNVDMWYQSYCKTHK